jgi:hypothetical protein
MDAEPEMDEEVKRCRKVRVTMDKRFRTFDAYCDFLERLDRARRRKAKRVLISAAHAKTKSRSLPHQRGPLGRSRNVCAR